MSTGNSTSIGLRRGDEAAVVGGGSYEKGAATFRRVYSVIGRSSGSSSPSSAPSWASRRPTAPTPPPSPRQRTAYHRPRTAPRATPASSTQPTQWGAHVLRHEPLDRAERPAGGGLDLHAPPRPLEPQERGLRVAPAGRGPGPHRLRPPPPGWHHHGNRRGDAQVRGLRHRRRREQDRPGLLTTSGAAPGWGRPHRKPPFFAGGRPNLKH